jgi:hypothetical protein
LRRALSFGTFFAMSLAQHAPWDEWCDERVKSIDGIAVLPASVDSFS